MAGNTEAALVALLATKETGLYSKHILLSIHHQSRAEVNEHDCSVSGEHFDVLDVTYPPPFDSIPHIHLDGLVPLPLLG